MRTFVFTIDTEWSPAEIVADVLRQFEDANVSVTLFCTDHPKVEVDSRHELAIHPNITSLEGAEATVRDVLRLYPEAKGIRTHGLVSASQFYDFYGALGLRYQSNAYLGVPVPRIASCRGIASLPIFFMDHAQIVDCAAPDFSVKSLGLQDDGIYVFVFHPIITFINCHSEEHYHHAKTCYRDPTALKRLIGGQRGIRDLLTELLELVHGQSIATSTCLDLVADVAKP